MAFENVVRIAVKDSKHINTVFFRGNEHPIEDVLVSSLFRNVSFELWVRCAFLTTDPACSNGHGSHLKPIWFCIGMIAPVETPSQWVSNCKVPTWSLHTRLVLYVQGEDYEKPASQIQPQKPQAQSWERNWISQAWDDTERSWSVWGYTNIGVDNRAYTHKCVEW